MLLQMALAVNQDCSTVMVDIRISMLAPFVFVFAISKFQNYLLEINLIAAINMVTLYIINYSTNTVLYECIHIWKM